MNTVTKDRTELSDLRTRLRAALRNTSRPLHETMNEYRMLLIQSRISAGRVDPSPTNLEDSF